MRDADLEPTGRELADPAATLVECVDSEGLKHTVISFNEEYRGHSTLTTDVDLIMSFMAYPMVTGLVECSAADTKRARFAYPTGTIWTVKEVLRGFDQVNQQIGVRAAIELLYLGGMIVHEAGETGPLQGCFSHGNLNPWRIGLKADGQVQIFGYGLAQVEMYEFVKGDGEHVGHDSIRYAPPERLEGQPEQPSSDTYALAVMAYELITGKPLYDQKEPQKMWDAVKLAEGIQTVRNDKKVPKTIRSLLVDALTYDPDKRLHGMELVDRVGGLLDDPKLEGRTLLQVMERMLNTGTRSSRKLVKAATSAFSMDALKKLAEEEGDDVDLPEAEAEEEGGEESRWGAVTREGTTGRGGRRRRRSSDDAPSAEDEEGPKRRRRRKRREPDSPEAGEEAAEATPASEEPEEEKPRKRRRKSRRAKDAEASKKADETQVSTLDDTKGAAASDAEPEKAEAKKEEPKKAETQKAEAPKGKDEAADDGSEDLEEAPAPRRRRRKSRKSDDEAEEKTAKEKVEEVKPPEVAPNVPPVAEKKESKKTSTDGNAEDATAVAQKDGPPEPDVADDEPADTPRRRRRRQTAETPPEVAEDSPRRRRRRTAPADEAPPAEAPRRRRRRKPDEVKAEGEGQGEDAPRRRRRRKPDAEE